MSDQNPKEENIKIRTTAMLKDQLEQIADDRSSYGVNVSTSEVARDALYRYVEEYGSERGSESDGGGDESA